MHTDIKRYKCTVKDRRGEFGDCMSKDPEGAYVLHATHVNIVNQLTAKIRKQEEQIKLLLLQ